MRKLFCTSSSNRYISFSTITSPVNLCVTFTAWPKKPTKQSIYLSTKSCDSLQLTWTMYLVTYTCTKKMISNLKQVYSLQYYRYLTTSSPIEKAFSVPFPSTSPWIRSVALKTRCEVGWVLKEDARVRSTHLVREGRGEGDLLLLLEGFLLQR